MVQTRASIAHDLRRIGLAVGDAVVVHSSLRSLGTVEGGAQTVVSALLDVIGADGLLMAPVFSYSCRDFDPLTEPGLTGAIAEAIRTWPGAHRSLHPTHSVAAIGKDAEAIVAGHHRMSAIAVGSPLDRVAARGGWVLLLGCGHNQNSTIHVAEIHADVSYKDVPWSDDFVWDARVKTPDGVEEVRIIHPSGCSRGFGGIEWHLRQRGVVRDGLVGSSIAQLMRGRNLIATVVDLLRDDPTALLCNDPNCYRCTHARQVCHQGASV